MALAEIRRSKKRSPQEIEALVFGIIAAADAPLSAYDIANRASEKVVPNQVYRTLARLIDRRCVQRIECLSAYIRRDGDADACLICHACHRITMIAQSALRARIQELADATGFIPNHTLIEAHGLCADCLGKPH